MGNKPIERKMKIKDAIFIGNGSIFLNLNSRYFVFVVFWTNERFGLLIGFMTTADVGQQTNLHPTKKSSSNVQQSRKS